MVIGRHAVSDPAHREILTVAQREHPAKAYLKRISGTVEPRPDVPGLVDIREVDLEILLIFALDDDVLACNHPVLVAAVD